MLHMFIQLDMKLSDCLPLDLSCTVSIPSFGSLPCSPHPLTFRLLQELTTATNSIVAFRVIAATPPTKCLLQLYHLLPLPRRRLRHRRGHGRRHHRDASRLLLFHRLPCSLPQSMPLILPIMPSTPKLHIRSSQPMGALSIEQPLPVPKNSDLSPKLDPSPSHLLQPVPARSSK